MVKIKGKYKTRYFIAVILIILFLWTQGIGLISFPGVGYSAKAAIKTKHIVERNGWRFKKMICEINIDKERKLVLFENIHDETMVTYLEKNWAGAWKVMETTGEIPKKNKYKNVSIFGGKFKDIYLYGGYIYKNEVSKVKLRGHEAKVVNVGQQKFWYIANKKDIAKNIIELELFDSKGNIIELLEKDVK